MYVYVKCWCTKTKLIVIMLYFDFGTLMLNLYIIYIVSDITFFIGILHYYG